MALVLAIGSTSCKQDEFLDVNTDPNNPLIVPPSVLMTSTLITTAFANGNEINRISSLLVQHQAGIANQPATYDVYSIRGGLDNQWQGELYAGALENAQDLIRVAAANNSPAYAGIAKLLKAYNFAMVTDLWGNVPYSQALQGLELLQPRFDNQEDIYKGNASLNIQGLFDLVKEGLANLDETSTLLPSATDDPVYAGNLTKWKKMGNTMLLKLANTINRKDPALATTITNEVLAKGEASYISSNDDDFQVPFGGTVGNQNPIYSYNYVNRPDDQMLSQRLLDSMAVRNDPRLPLFFTTTPDATTNTTATVTSVGRFTGYQNGNIIAAPIRANRSRYGIYVRGNGGEAPIRLLTNFQVLFIRAESALRLNTAGDAQDLYRRAIRASMLKAGVTDAAVTAYLAANPAVNNLTGTTEQKLNKILTQKWIAWVGNGYEAYNDYRRTGYPRLAQVLNPAGDDNTRPNRFPYPASETSGNSANAPSPDPLNSARVWWDVD